MIIQNISTEIQGIESRIGNALVKNAQLKVLATDGSLNVTANKENMKASFDLITSDLKSTMDSIEKIRKMIEESK